MTEFAKPVTAGVPAADSGTALCDQVAAQCRANCGERTQRKFAITGSRHDMTDYQQQRLESVMP